MKDEKRLIDELKKMAEKKQDHTMLKKLGILESVIAKAKTTLKDSIKIAGFWQIKCFEGNKLKWVDAGHNLVVTTGLGHIADQLGGTPAQGAMSHMAAGSDNTAPAAGQTALISQIGSRVALDSATQSSNTVIYVCTFGPGDATGTWEEVGIFNASTSGVMLDRLLTSTKVKAAAETFEVTITLTISAA